ncbi:hypothetical protein [Streptomyces sp. CMB-StM0423]|uniref:hypothetical protein n=1 Tax=Streptomyces sp. CMB-StM0423 TaxID=2059884 RepID=UPI000C708853|nr:hypothetical protein [Streptomyces sp. CMB-StM0423]AUH40509.1 hypothetical protein CXR04_09830 [Streptomyces sp. CMB-StM0423]
MPGNPGSGREAESPLADRIEAVTGHGPAALRAYRNRGLLDEPHARLVDEHDALARAGAGVDLYLRVLHRLADGALPVDDALLTRIDRTVAALKNAAAARDGAARRVTAALEPIEATATSTTPGPRHLSEAEQHALLAIAGGAKLYQHLLSGQVSVTAASGTRIPYAELQRLEGAGLVARDTSRPLNAGQPITLTDTGRAALLAARRPPTTSPPKPGPWPSSAAHRR